MPKIVATSFCLQRPKAAHALRFEQFHSYTSWVEHNWHTNLLLSRLITFMVGDKFRWRQHFHKKPQIDLIGNDLRLV